jgi:hypothetical protein
MKSCQHKRVPTEEYVLFKNKVDLHEGYTADYFLNRMKPNALRISNPFSSIFFFFNQVPTFFIRLLHMCILEKFYRVIFCFLVLIGQYLSRNWLLNT